MGWLWWRTWGPLVARGAATLCVAGVALGDMDVLCLAGVALGGRGAWRHGRSICVAGAAVMTLGWQARQL